MQLPGSGHPQPIAAGAEVIAQRSDEAEAPTGFRDVEIACRPAGAMGRWQQRPTLLQLAANLRQRHELLGARLSDLAERHDLDQGHLMALAVRPGDQIGQFGQPVAQRHDVDLDREASLARGGYAFEQFATFNTKDRADNIEFQKTKLPMPVLALGADHSFGDTQAVVMREVATNVEGGIVKNSGHWIMEEQPKQTVGLIKAFLEKK